MGLMGETEAPRGLIHRAMESMLLPSSHAHPHEQHLQLGAPPMGPLLLVLTSSFLRTRTRGAAHPLPSLAPPWVPGLFLPLSPMSNLWSKVGAGADAPVGSFLPSTSSHRSTQVGAGLCVLEVRGFPPPQLRTQPAVVMDEEHSPCFSLKSITYLDGQYLQGVGEVGPGSSALPGFQPHCLSLPVFILFAAEDPCCTQPAHHYPPSRAISARLRLQGLGSCSWESSSRTLGAGASVV